MVAGRLLSLFAALLVWGMAQAAPQPVTVLYKKDTAGSADRLSPAVQSALQAFDAQLLEAGFQVIQPEPQVYETLDRAQGVIVTFSEAAGYSVLFDLMSSSRPYPGTDRTYAEVRIRARVFHGRTVLASVAELGRTAYRNAGAADHAFETAARHAVGIAVTRIAEQLAAAPPLPAPAQPAFGAEAALTDETRLIAPTGRKWALLVGVSDYRIASRNLGYALKDLSGVSKDMPRMKEALLRIGVGEDSLIYLLDRQATQVNVRAAFRRLRDEAQPEDLIYVFLSTHGLPKVEGVTGFGFPVLFDHSERNYLDFDELRQTFGLVEAKNIIWINDTCHSGHAADGLATIEIAAPGRRPGLVRSSTFDARRAARHLEGKNLVVIASADASEEAAETNDGSIFAEAFFQGIREITRQPSAGLPSSLAFYRHYLDGPVQKLFAAACQKKPTAELCLRQQTQRPVYATHGPDGFRLQM